MVETLGLAPNVSEEMAAARKTKATSDLERRFARIETLLAKERRAEERLVSLGAEVDAERNAERMRWLKRGGSSALLLGGLAALCVFFPAAIPLVGRVLGLLVTHMPGMAGATGVVSVKAFDSVVRAVERSKHRRRVTKKKQARAECRSGTRQKSRSQPMLRVELQTRATTRTGSQNCTATFQAKWTRRTSDWCANGKAHFG